MNNKENLHKLVKEIQQEVQELTEAREAVIKIKKQMTEAGFSEDQAIRRIAEAIGLDFRSVKNWLRKQSNLQHQNLLKVILFLDAYKKLSKDD